MTAGYGTVRHWLPMQRLPGGRFSQSGCAQIATVSDGLVVATSIDDTDQRRTVRRTCLQSVTRLALDKSVHGCGDAVSERSNGFSDVGRHSVLPQTRCLILCSNERPGCDAVPIGGAKAEGPKCSRDLAAITITERPGQFN